MSEQYKRRLIRVRNEYDAAREAVSHVRRNWHQQNIFLQIEGIELSDLDRTTSDLESIFTIWLFATFEGILKDHLLQGPNARPGIEEDSVFNLINYVARRQQPPMNPNLRQQVHEVREYRNTLVHRNLTSQMSFTFSDVLRRLSKYVDKLPDPPR